jgi:DNA polymerase-3 subunit delta
VKISARQLDGHLKKGLGKLYAVHGAEALVALEAADRIREAARRDGCTEREVFFAEPGVDWNRLGASASNLSLFASRRLVELRIPTGKPGAEGGKAIDAWAAKLPDDAVTLVLLPELEWQQQKTKWFESLERNGVLVEAKCITRDELPDWLAERLSRQQQRASVETLEWLAERVEGNLLAAKQEVEKLALLLPPGEITLAAIREALPLLLWVLAEELRAMMAITAGQRSRRFLSPARMESLNRTARRHNAASFHRELLRAHKIDRMIKGVETGDPWQNIVELAMGIAGKPVLVEAA